MKDNNAKKCVYPLTSQNVGKSDPLLIRTPLSIQGSPEDDVIISRQIVRGPEEGKKGASQPSFFCVSFVHIDPMLNGQIQSHVLAWKKLLFCWFVTVNNQATP